MTINSIQDSGFYCKWFSEGLQKFNEDFFESEILAVEKTAIDY